ncbi:MAG: DEAD/DEAH box helicase [Pseudomonadota bacterium]
MTTPTTETTTATLDFQSLGLPAGLLAALEVMNFTTPTPIQAQTIPLALKGMDVLGTANTGTGKTGAYGIPLVAHLLNNPQAGALVLAPTRELAAQVQTALKEMLGRGSGVQSALLIGGDSIAKQMKQLRARPRLLVGTPGRVNDHLVRTSLRLNNVDFVVFDETDRMLDMGFLVQLQKIANFLPEKRQTLMFSATMAPSIVKVAQSYLHNPQRVSVGSTTTPTAHIKQEILRISESEKYALLAKLLGEIKGTVIVFAKTKYSTEKLSNRLREDGFDTDAIHGDLRQRNRTQVIKSFRDGEIRILVATDVAARGLDIPDIECVINNDLPQCPEDYIHRIGRTGRAGAGGRAISLISPQDNVKWRDIARLMNPNEREQRGGRDRDEGDRSSSRRPSQGRTRSFDRPRDGFAASEQRPFRRASEGNRAESRDEPRRESRGPRSDEPRREFRPRSSDEPRREFRPRSADEPRREFRPRSADEPRREFRPRSSDEPRREFRPRDDARGNSFPSERKPFRERSDRPAGERFARPVDGNRNPDYVKPRSEKSDDVSAFADRPRRSTGAPRPFAERNGDSRERRAPRSPDAYGERAARPAGAAGRFDRPRSADSESPRSRPAFGDRPPRKEFGGQQGYAGRKAAQSGARRPSQRSDKPRD